MTHSNMASGASRLTDTRLGGDQGWYALDVPGDRTIPLTLDELSATLFGLPEATTFFVR